MRFQFSLSILAAIALSSVSATPFGSCSLETGLYRIYNVDKGIYVNRFYIEDRSLRPKRVVAVKEDRMPPWIAQADSGKVTLKAASAPTTSIDGKVFGVLLDYPEPTEWTIVSPKCNDIYTIKDKDENSWHLDSDEEYQSQVTIGKEQQWRFERIDEVVHTEDTSSRSSHGQIVINIQY